MVAFWSVTPSQRSDH